MRFLSLSLRIVLLFLLSVKGCQFCLKVVYNVFQSKMGFILTNEDDKYFCCLLENEINEKMQDQNKIEIDLDENKDEEEVSDFQKNEVKEVKEEDVNEITVKEVNKITVNEVKEAEEVKEVNEIKELNKETTNEQLLRTGAIKKTPRFPVKDLDQLGEKFPVKEGTSSKNDCDNSETCESALLARLKNDQKSLKLLDLKMNKLRIKTSETEETPKKYFCFREDRPWH